MKSVTALTIKGEAVENETVGTLRTAEMNGDLGEQLRQEGYLFLRNLHDLYSVEAARLEVLNGCLSASLPLTETGTLR